MAQRKPFSELSQKGQEKYVNREYRDQLEEELMLLDTDNHSSIEKQWEFGENQVLQNPCAREKTGKNEAFFENMELINDIPLFWGEEIEENTTESHKTDDVEKYFNEKKYREFCRNFLIVDEGENEKFFEEQEYSYSDSETDSENEDYFRSELKEIGRDMKRDNLNRLLKLLHEMGHEELPVNAKKLLETPKTTKIKVCENGEYWHYGLEQALDDIIQRGFSLPETIEIDVGFDGMPLGKSGRKKLWPVTGRVFNKRSVAPFLIGCYYGTTSPTSATPYLTDFIEEFKNLQNKTIALGNKKHKIVLRNVICDTPARCLVLGVSFYNGYYGCAKCEVEGSWRKNKIVFLEEDCPLRTNDTFRDRLQPEHHREYSPFEKLKINMIENFPLDYMHLVCLGIMKLLLKTWFRSKKALFSARAIANLSEILENFAKYVPKEFSRKTQGLSDMGRWKATQLRFCLLYVGPIVLQKQLPLKILRHFNTLSCAIRILCHPKEYKTNNKTAEDLLIHFVSQMKDKNFYYGQEFITFNVHNLIHLARECLNNNGTLDSFSAFEFENFLQFIKKLIRKYELPLQQLHRRISEGHTLQKKTKRLKNGKYELRNQIKRGTPPYNCDEVYRKVVFEDFELSLKTPDNCCLIKTNSKPLILLIEAIGTKDGKEYVFGKTIRNTFSLPDYPIGDSRHVGIFALGKLSDNIQSYEVGEIDTKMVYCLYKNKGYAIEMLHHSN